MNTLDTSRRSIDSLTGLRFIAAMAVYLFHFGAGFLERAGASSTFVNILKNGYFGVSIFFILSGFILYYTYQNSVSSFNAYKDFIVARFARIYPVYILVLLLALPVTTRPTDFESILRVLSMTQSWTLPASDLGFAWVTQAWTLSIELFFYLSFPLIAGLAGRLTKFSTVCALLALCSCILFGSLSTLTPSTVGADIPSWVYQLPLPLLRTFEFAYGVLLCKVYLSSSHESRLRFSSNWVGLLFLAAIAIPLALSTQRISVAVASIAGGLLILHLSSGASYLSGLLSNKHMILAGGASYSMYLLQGPVHDYVKILKLGPTSPLLQFILCLGGAVLLFKFYEEPVRRIIKKAVGGKS